MGPTIRSATPCQMSIRLLQRFTHLTSRCETSCSLKKMLFMLLHDYVVHAVKQTTSPLCYHLGVGLSILSCTCPLDYGMHYAGKLRANMFALLVGRSGEDQKSSALGIGRDLLFDAASPLVGDFPGSPEGLIDSLARSPSQCIPISEFGRFLASAQRGYFEPIKALLADLWDCHAIQRAKANGKSVRVEDPRLSVMAACSIPYLEKYTLAEDWSGGFMGRWAVLYGRRERTDPDPSGDDSDAERLAEFLRTRATVPSWLERLHFSMLGIGANPVLASLGSWTPRSLNTESGLPSFISSLFLI